MAAGSGPARSMLVRDDRIVAVGPAEPVRAAAAPGARVVGLEGAAVIPGLIDAHCHLCNVGYLASGADCSQPAAPDIPALLARLREAAGRTPEGSWVTGSGYVEYKLRERQHPTRADLDAAVPNRPAILFHTSLHACVLNTPALREAGFDDREPDPPGGHFGRDSEGRLDGVIHEGPTFSLLWGGLRRDMQRMSAVQRAGLVARAGQHFAGLGVTAACDADTRRDSLTAYAEADEQGVLGVRIAGLVVHDEADWLLGSGLRGRRSPRLAADSVKIWADGGMSSRTAAIHGSYPVPPYARHVHHRRRVRHAPGTRHRHAGAGQARGLRDPRPQPAGDRTRADHRHPGPGDGRRRAARLPHRRFTPPAMTAGPAADVQHTQPGPPASPRVP